MSFRLYWLKYDDNPFTIKKGDLEKFETEDEAVEKGCAIIEDGCCHPCNEDPIQLAEHWKRFKYIHHSNKWHGLKLQLFTDDSYLSIFENDFKEREND